MNTVNEIKHIFKAAVDAVRPSSLVSRAIKYANNVVHIQESTEYEINHNCHMIGFGKAVLGMALQMEQILGNHIQKGILSIPHGVISQHTLSDKFLSKFKILEGAANNVPDEDSLQATSEIMDMVSSLEENDILFVLISGGGSALLTSPINGISLEEKQKTIQLLSKSGANINELNCVRKKLSRIKGGKLAQLAYPKTTISLILSDVIGNPLAVIASGPTVENKDSADKGWDVIQNYNIESLLPAKVAECVKSSQVSSHNEIPFDHVQNYLIGSNLTALQAAEASAAQLGYSTFILSDRIQGEAKEVGQHFAQLAQVIAQMMTGFSDEQHRHIEALSIAVENLYMDPRCCCKLERLVRGCLRSRKNLCLIGGGESTVKVRGSGLGGRNQEMALSFLNETATDNWVTDELDIVFLSAGSDGIDGPTNAAGAVVFKDLFVDAQQQGLDIRAYLDDNDSFSFFQALRNGTFHVITGPSGTNVMDVHLLILKWK